MAEPVRLGKSLMITMWAGTMSIVVAVAVAALLPELGEKMALSANILMAEKVQTAQQQAQLLPFTAAAEMEATAAEAVAAEV